MSSFAILFYSYNILAFQKCSHKFYLATHCRASKMDIRNCQIPNWRRQLFKYKTIISIKIPKKLNAMKYCSWLWHINVIENRAIIWKYSCYKAMRWSLGINGVRVMVFNVTFNKLRSDICVIFISVQRKKIQSNLCKVTMKTTHYK